MPEEDKSRKPRVVIDTNVYVSGLNFRGAPREILELMRKDIIKVVISPFILQELEKVLIKDFDWDEERAISTLRLIHSKATEVFPRHSISVIKAKDSDNRILECAKEGKAHYLISGDKRHLLPLKEYEGIKIVSPAEFLNYL